LKFELELSNGTRGEDKVLLEIAALDCDSGVESGFNLDFICGAD
jgi:hypothetical protein